MLFYYYLLLLLLLQSAHGARASTVRCAPLYIKTLDSTEQGLYSGTLP
jgi:hypothetical protein